MNKTESGPYISNQMDLEKLERSPALILNLLPPHPPPPPILTSHLPVLDHYKQQMKNES